MTGAAGRLAHPIGRRGRALLTFAVLDIIWGVRLATVDAGTTDFYGWLNTLCPLWWWSLPWFAVAALCLAGAFRACDRVGFGSAIGIKIGWAVLNLCAELFGGVPDAWPAAALFTAFAVCVYWMAGTPEPLSREGVAWTPPLL